MSYTGALRPLSPAGIDASDLDDVDGNNRSDTPVSAISWIPTPSDTAFGRVPASTNGVKGVLTARLAAAIYDVGGMRTGFGGRESDDGRDIVSATPPEIDVTDLVMDNNDYYTQASVPTRRRESWRSPIATCHRAIGGNGSHSCGYKNDVGCA